MVPGPAASKSILMPTSYPGREDEHDLGNGHSFTWMTDQAGAVFGLIAHHPPGPDSTPGSLYCGGYIAWSRSSSGAPEHPHHQLVAGGPGMESTLTVHPSLLCRTCKNHGWIRQGRWTDA